MLKRFADATLVTTVISISICLVASVFHFEFIYLSVIRDSWFNLNRLDVMISAGFRVLAGIPFILVFSISPFYVLRRWAGRDKEQTLSI